jgi:hypothetical protein
MPAGITYIIAVIADFLPVARRFDGVGIDIGGPRFRYEDCLTRFVAEQVAIEKKLVTNLVMARKE